MCSEQGSAVLLCHDGWGCWGGIFVTTSGLHVSVASLLALVQVFPSVTKQEFIFHGLHGVAATKTTAATESLVKGTQSKEIPQRCVPPLPAGARQTKYPRFV